MAEELALDRVSWRAGRTLIIDDVEVAFPPGVVTGVLGPNGSGKSTLLRLIVGAFPPSSGTLMLGGRDLGTLTRRARARRVALVEQDHATDVPLNALDVVLLGRIPHTNRWFGDGSGDAGLALEMLAKVGADHLAERPYAELSGGERQRVHIARALAQEPSLLLLDEPTNHLDIAAQLNVLKLVSGFDGVTTVTALHDLNHAMNVCQYVVLLDQGKVVAAGSPAEVLTPARLEQVYRVEAEIIRHRGRTWLIFSELDTLE